MKRDAAKRKAALKRQRRLDRDREVAERAAKRNAEYAAAHPEPLLVIRAEGFFCNAPWVQKIISDHPISTKVKDDLVEALPFEPLEGDLELCPVTELEIHLDSGDYGLGVMGRFETLEVPDIESLSGWETSLLGLRRVGGLANRATDLPTRFTGTHVRGGPYAADTPFNALPRQAREVAWVHGGHPSRPRCRDALDALPFEVLLDHAWSGRVLGVRPLNVDTD